MLMLVSCLHDREEAYLKSILFDDPHRIMGVDYGSNADTAIQQIIFKSGVRSKGYGVILNVDHALTVKGAANIIEEFKHEDINAVHVFDVQTGQDPANNIVVAVKNARFTWVFASNIYDLSGEDCRNMLDAFHQSTANGGILVINKKQMAKFMECMDLPTER